MPNRKHLAFPLIFAAGLVAGGGTLAALGMAAQDDESAIRQRIDQAMSDLDRKAEQLERDRQAIEVERDRIMRRAQEEFNRSAMMQAREQRDREVARAETRERFLPGPVDVWFTAEAGPVSRPNQFRGVTYVDTLSVGGTSFAAFERDGQMRLVSPAAIAALTPASRDEAGEAMDAAEDAMEEMGDQMNEAVEAAE